MVSGPVEIVWYTAMSMDGRIASGEGSLDFLETLAGSGADDFGDFIATVDAALVGAGTFRWLLAQGHGWPHDDLPTWLASHDAQLAESVRPTRAPLVCVVGDPRSAIDEMEQSRRRRVWLAGGGSVAAQVLALDRLDEVIATVAPTALGNGPALFDAPALPRRAFDLVECRTIGQAARLRWVRRPLQGLDARSFAPQIAAAMANASTRQAHGSPTPASHNATRPRRGRGS